MSKTAILGHWVPETLDIDKEETTKCVKGFVRAAKITHPSLKALQHLIESDPVVNMLFITMFEEKFNPPQKNPISDYMDMLLKMETIISSAPKYGSNLGSAPLNHLLRYVMATPSGTMAFINDKVNKCFRAILQDWAQYLNSPASKEVLNTEDGWLCKASLKKMCGFLKTFKVDDEDKRYYGFKSWNDFFARELKNDKVRPIADPEDPFVICSPCDATPNHLEKNVKLRDQFWIKAQPYSLQHLLNDDPMTEKYVGGTVYQAFLDTANYHRWHSPVDGKITKAYIKEGAYYAEALSMGYDPTANTESQRYLSHVDTRAIIHIDTGNPKIRTVIFIAVGMAEISSCPIAVYFGQQVKKGDPLGHFQFGGSTYCLVFEKDVDVHFLIDGKEKSDWPLQHVNSALGIIGKV